MATRSLVSRLVHVKTPDRPVLPSSSQLPLARPPHSTLDVDKLIAMAHREYLLPDLLEVSTVRDTSSDAAVDAANGQRDSESSRDSHHAVSTPPSFLEDLDPMNDDDLTPPLSPPRTISRDAIDAAFTELKHRERAASVGDVDEDEELNDDVVIARDVSPEELERVPDHWLDGLDVMLRHDGVLIAVATPSHQRTDAARAVYDAVAPQAARQGLACKSNFFVDLGGGRSAKVDVLLYHVDVDTGIHLARVAYHAVMPHVTNPAMLEHVAECFTLVPSLHSFVCFRFTGVPVNPLAPQELRLPAFAVEFHRGAAGDTVNYRGRRLQRIGVVQIRSMGNGGVSQRCLNSFHGVRRHALITDDVPAAQLNVLQQPSLEFPDALDRNDRAASADRALAIALRRAQPFTVVMPAPQGPFHVDLPIIFHAAIVGWSMDHPQAVPVGGNMNVAPVNHGVGGGVLARWQRGDWTLWGMVTFVLRRIFRLNV